MKDEYLEPNPLLIVISSPSGAGKDAVVQRMRELGYPFHFVVTATSRPPRPGEMNGKDYWFVSCEEFEEMIEQGELLEHAIVYGQHKGVPKKHVRRALESGQDVVMRVDVQGAATIRCLIPDAVLIFIVASSEEELVERLKRRGTESEEQLQKRIATIRREMGFLPGFDYVVVNREGQLDETVRQILAIITAEKCCVQQREVEL